MAGQTFSDAVKNTFTDKTSWAIIGSSTAIGAVSAALFSGVTQGFIFSKSTATGHIGNLHTGTMKEFNINQPEWAGSGGVFGENIVPTAIDLGKEINNVIEVRK